MPDLILVYDVFVNVADKQEHRNTIFSYMKSRTCLDGDVVDIGILKTMS